MSDAVQISQEVGTSGSKEASGSGTKDKDAGNGGSGNGTAREEQKLPTIKGERGWADWTRMYFRSGGASVKDGQSKVRRAAGNILVGLHPTNTIDGTGAGASEAGDSLAPVCKSRKVVESLLRTTHAHFEIPAKLLHVFSASYDDVPGMDPQLLALVQDAHAAFRNTPAGTLASSLLSPSSSGVQAEQVTAADAARCFGMMLVFKKGGAFDKPIVCVGAAAEEATWGCLGTDAFRSWYKKSTMTVKLRLQNEHSAAVRVMWHDIHAAEKNMAAAASAQAGGGTAGGKQQDPLAETVDTGTVKPGKVVNLNTRFGHLFSFRDHVTNMLVGYAIAEPSQSPVHVVTIKAVEPARLPPSSTGTCSSSDASCDGDKPGANPSDANKIVDLDAKLAQLQSRLANERRLFKQAVAN
jgi:hypothetical protein